MAVSEPRTLPGGAFAGILQKRTNRALNPVYESMTRLEVRAPDEDLALMVIRVWRSEAALEDAANPRVGDLHACVSALPPDVTIASAAKAVASLPRIAAVECLRPRTGAGLVFYPDWT